MKMDLDDGYSILVTGPESCTDFLSIMITENNTAKAMVSLDATHTAKLISALRKKFMEFSD